MILMVYNKEICKDFLLPNIHDADEVVALQHDDCHLREDVRIRLQKSDAGWEMEAGGNYRIKTGEGFVQSHLLKSQDIVEVHTDAKERFYIVVIDEEMTFDVAGKYQIANMKEISIGKKEGNLIQYQFMGFVSSVHAVLQRHSDGWYLEDSSTNGVFVDCLRMNRSRKLSFGDHIHIFGLHLVFLNDILAVHSKYGDISVREDILRPMPEEEVEEEGAEGQKMPEKPYFHRSPRHLPIIHSGEVEIDAPPAAKVVKEKPLFYTIGPAFTMAIPMMLGCGFMIFGSRISGSTSGAFMYTGLITAVSSAFIGVIWAVLNLNYTKKEAFREENLRFNAYSNYLIQITDAIREKYAQNQEAMLSMYPAPQECVRFHQGSNELWNRNLTHPDFLFQRLGTGDFPFQMQVHVPKEKFTLVDDSLLEKPKMIQKEFRMLHNVPVGISLLDNPLVGLVGGTQKTGAMEIMYTLVAGIAAAHCYTDVKMVFVYRESDCMKQEIWDKLRWFPHVWSEDYSIRYMASTELEIGDIFFELGNIIRRRSLEAADPGGAKRKTCKPHYVIFVSDPELLEGQAVAKYIYNPKPEYGITTLLMVENLEDLPNECEVVVEHDRYFTGRYNLMETEAERQAFTSDRLQIGQLEEFGKRLANISVKEIETTSDIPAQLDFFEMYQVNSLEELEVQERWRKNRTYQSMKALVGKKAGNADCYLDIHEKFHGPHGLVAGTTGSGKSETLQTYILSLAVNFSPEDVSFFIIDFKGGGMANLFTSLPHMAGQISNLSGNQVQRAMISIKSENMRRQRLFGEYEVNNINSYTKLYKNHEAAIPIPHLLIVIDEFAELKREEPEFMKELISVAQVGRSLGVHLILATQKPGGTVDDNIWSNTKFRLCLRVQDRQDSHEMLHKPDAAFLTQAGRCYLQVGNDEIYELFQSGYSGAVYHADTRQEQPCTALLGRTGKVEMVGGWHKKEEVGKKKEKETTQLEAVVAYLQQLAAKNHVTVQQKLWLPVLREVVYLAELEERKRPASAGKWTLEAVIGEYDDPHNQAQEPLCLSFSRDGHMAVCGAAVSGKSTFLQSLVYSYLSRYTPDEVQMYLIDFSSHMLMPFAQAPHVGGVVFDNQEEKLAKLFHMLLQMMEERKRLFQGGNYSQYVQANGVTVPAVLVIIDNLASVREKSGNKYDDVLLRLAREGVGYGIFLAVSAAGFGMAEIPSRMADNIRTVVCLEQTDRFKYMDILRTTRLQILPEKDIKGRGLAVVDGRVLEFQTALCLEAEDDFARGLKIEEFCRRLESGWKGKTAVPIPEIPEKPTLSELSRDARYVQMLAGNDRLPCGYYKSDAEIYGIDLRKTYCYLVSGRAHTGKTNALRLLLYAAGEKRAQIAVIEKNGTELKKLAESYGAEYITDASGLYRYLSGLLKEFSLRNKKKREYMEAGSDEEDLYAKMSQFPPVFLFLSDLSEFFEMAYKPGNGIGNMSGFLENIMEKGFLHRIYFIGCLKTEDQNLLSVYKAYQHFISFKTGMHLGGNLASQKIFNFQNIPFSQQSKSSKKGIGYVPDSEEENNGVEVVIPLAQIK